MSPAEQIARAFHETYERLAPDHGYETRPESAVGWEAVPDANKQLMVGVAAELLARGFVQPGPNLAAALMEGAR
jgi:hypothetical protein